VEFQQMAEVQEWEQIRQAMVTAFNSLLGNLLALRMRRNFSLTQWRQTRCLASVAGRISTLADDRHSNCQPSRSCSCQHLGSKSALSEPITFRRHFGSARISGGIASYWAATA
jgi:hypothetical protein